MFWVITIIAGIIIIPIFIFSMIYWYDWLESPALVKGYGRRQQLVFCKECGDSVNHWTKGPSYVKHHEMCATGHREELKFQPSPARKITPFVKRSSS